MLRLLVLVAVISSSVAANVLDKRGATATPFCSKVTKAVTAAHDQSAATAFCSSYLHIPVKTVTKRGVSTSTVTVKGTCPTPKANKRDGGGRSKPGCFSTYSGGVLSSACSCLHIAPSTTTVQKVVTTTTTKPATTCVSNIVACSIPMP